MTNEDIMEKLDGFILNDMKKAMDELERLRAENEHLKDMIKLYDEMVAALLPSWETEPDSDEKTQYMITYTAIKKALG